MIRPTHNPHTSFEGKFLLIPSQKHKKTRLIPKPSCYELRIYTPQEILSPREFSAEVAAYFLGKNLDTSLSKNNRQKSWPINFTFSHVQEKTITRWQWIFQISQMRFFWGPPIRHSPLCTNKITHTHTHTHTHTNIIKYFQNQLNILVNGRILTLRSFWVLNPSFIESCGTTQKDGLELSLV